jgi:Benzoyl-CoA reductase/2-hydroxyglutaryl-CoA dehydratase subunit, BcrC/BadD/HgdB
MTLAVQELSNDQWRYPDELGPLFTATDGINFDDGHTVSSEEIWRFLTQEAPKRFPHEFHRYATGFMGTSAGLKGRFRREIDVSYLSGLKTSYLVMTLKDRVNAARQSGVPIVLVQGAQPVEPYYAAGGIPLRPQYVNIWARNRTEGLNARQSALKSHAILEAGRRNLTSPDACNQVSAHAAIEEGYVDIDLVAPILCLRCSDMAYLSETHRLGKKGIPTYLVEYPVPGHDKTPTEGRIDLLTAELKKLTEKVAKLSGKKVTDEDLTAEIKIENKARRLLRECNDIWWNAKVPPTNSTDRASTLALAGDGCGDFSASLSVLEQTRDELKERVKHGVKGAGLKNNPVRIFSCGSCVGPNATLVDYAGGVIVGRDDGWSKTVVDVKETGDPWENLANAILSYPYELPTVERAEWIAREAKRSRADGVIFLYAWGCNYQTAVARMIADIVKDRTGLPTTTIEMELGQNDSEQSENRVEAFIEILRH